MSYQNDLGAGGFSNESYQTQSGEGNYAEVEQGLFYSEDNIATQIQGGIGNFARVEQSGYLHWSFENQIGDNNISNVHQFGNNQISTVNQIGNGNNSDVNQSNLLKLI